MDEGAQKSGSMENTACEVLFGTVEKRDEEGLCERSRRLREAYCYSMPLGWYVLGR
mgnify:CR=1 FL=1